MTAQDLIADLRSRINPAYANQRGTESHERKVCADALERLLVANTALVCALDRIHDVLRGEYVDDVALIVNNALTKNRETL